MNAKTIGIILNGSEILLKSNSLKELVDSLNLLEARFAVEINKEIVPKSPIEHPGKHHAVFFALLFHVCLQDQLKVKLSELI